MKARNPFHVLEDKRTSIPPHQRLGLTTFINPYSYLFYLRKTSLFSKFDYIEIDGILLVKLLNLFMDKNAKYYRKSFDMTSMAKELFYRCEETGKTLFFIGSSKKSIEGFVITINISFPILYIVGYKDGFFGDSKQSVFEEILRVSPDFVVAGMGTPLQETFLVELKQAGFKGSAFTCGGFIHQTAQRIEYYPPIVDRFNLRWLFRKFEEPKLYKRYFVYYPRSILLFFYDSYRNYR